MHTWCTDVRSNNVRYSCHRSSSGVTKEKAVSSTTRPRRQTSSSVTMPGRMPAITVVIGERRFVLHLVPAGIFQPETTCLIANGVVRRSDHSGERDHRNWRRWRAEPWAPVGIAALSPHPALPSPARSACMRRPKARAHGTTGRGIGPVFADKVSYLGLRVGDLFTPGRPARAAQHSPGIKEPRPDLPWRWSRYTPVSSGVICSRARRPWRPTSARRIH